MIVGISNTETKSVIFYEDFNPPTTPIPGFVWKYNNHPKSFSLQEYLKTKIQLLQRGWEVMEY
jgi:hypothetical protein